MQKDRFIFVFFHRDLEVVNIGVLFGEFLEFVVVRGEECFCLEVGLGGDVLGYGLCDANAVVGAGAAADFVHDDQAFGRGVAQDVGGLYHFDHES